MLDVRRDMLVMRVGTGEFLSEFRPRIFGIPPLDENEIMDSGLIF